ncbi:MAG: hypothetical protein NTZ09_03435 [Candidatus Hydrogenedentes bacterium]|nr:hypothetical protein [Candidatus Hydrogenedentota bacterium]
MCAAKRKTSPRVARNEVCATSNSPDDIWQQNPEIIKRFLNVRSDCEQLCTEVEYTLRKRVSGCGIEVASITSRAKTLDSFLEKLQRKHYEDPFKEVTDLAGARVVCLYRDDIEKVAKMITSEFVVVEDEDKISNLKVDQFGYGARHFLVRLGKASSGARYDDLRSLVCEIQVRTVVQDAWAIIQHHMTYKHDAQVPTQLQRKLNGLAGLFETVDDQFESMRRERDAYLVGVRESASVPDAFLENELNLDSFKEYLRWAFPHQGLESWDGMARLALDGLVKAGHKKLRDVHRIVEKTAETRKALIKEVGQVVARCEDGTVPASLEAAFALGLTAPDWQKLLVWGDTSTAAIKKYRS